MFNEKSVIPEPEAITVITIKKNGNEVFTEVSHVEGYDPIRPEEMITACSGVITEYGKYVTSEDID